jgi:hypothetical protein
MGFFKIAVRHEISKFLHFSCQFQFNYFTKSHFTIKIPAIFGVIANECHQLSANPAILVIRTLLGVLKNSPYFIAKLRFTIQFPAS